MHFPAVPADNATCQMHSSVTTHARCWTLSENESEDVALRDGEFFVKLSSIESGLRTALASPVLYLITACGDPYKPDRPIQISNDRQRYAEFDALNRLVGLTTHSSGLYTTLRPQCSYSYEYDDSLTQVKAIVILVRAPTNSRAVVCVMRIQVSDLSCLAFVCCPRQEDLEDIRNLCGANAAVLRANPLGLLSIIFDHRARSWEVWVTRLWLQVNQMEGLTKSAPPGWLMNDPVSVLQRSVGSTTLSPASVEPSRHHTMTQLTTDPMPTALTALELQDFEPTPFHDLGNTEKLLPRLYTTDTEISHGQNVMSFAIRYADFCLDAVNVVDSARMGVGLPPQTPGAKALVADRIRFTKSRCLGLQDRFTEIRERHRSQINASFSLIAHQESKISLDVARLVAIDSRTMKTIGVLTLVFLPATLVTSLWQANVFHLTEDTNAKVYVGTTVAVTAFVFSCWWMYMHFSRKPLCGYDRAPATAGWGAV